MDKTIDDTFALPDSSPAGALAPIRRLVLGAFVFALLAGTMLVASALHVMSTTDALSMAEERGRAARIADSLADWPPAEAASAALELGRLAGLDEVALTQGPESEGYRQSMPLLAGPLRGKFLTWTAERPGEQLFFTFAPLRVPLMLVLICSVLACLVAMLRHVRRLEIQRRIAQRQALRDHLTGLPNRLALENQLRHLARERRGFSILAMDLDRFKPVNDLFGHHAGDLALIEVAQRLAAQLQPDEMLARLGGDEFVAIVHRDGESHALGQMARDCIAAVTEPLASVGSNVTVGISIGIVEEGLGLPVGAPLKLADRALYDAKRLRGGAYCFAGEAGRRTRRGAGTPESGPSPRAAIA